MCTELKMAASSETPQWFKDKVAKKYSEGIPEELSHINNADNYAVLAEGMYRFSFWHFSFWSPALAIWQL